MNIKQIRFFWENKGHYNYNIDEILHDYSLRIRF